MRLLLRIEKEGADLTEEKSLLWQARHSLKKERDLLKANTKFMEGIRVKRLE